MGCRPVCLEGLLDIKAEHNAAKLVVGNTEVGIELKFKHAGYPVLVGTTHVPELNTIEVSPSLMQCCHATREHAATLEIMLVVAVGTVSQFCMLADCIACACIGAPFGLNRYAAFRCLMTPWWLAALSR